MMIRAILWEKITNNNVWVLSIEKRDFKKKTLPKE
jgi:hypothetical protein